MLKHIRNTIRARREVEAMNAALPVAAQLDPRRRRSFGIRTFRESRDAKRGPSRTRKDYPAFYATWLIDRAFARIR